jgi:hypothetical protein
MQRFLVLMNSDTESPEQSGLWDSYINGLIEAKHLLGGSSLGNGVTVRKPKLDGTPIANHVGYLLLEATNIEEAKTLLLGNPVYEAGGSIEIHELVAD